MSRPQDSRVSVAWSWRHAVCQSDLAPVTRHLLLVLAMFMNEMGEGCYPSVADLVRYSGLDKKTVLKHLGVAREAGWIAVAQHGYRGQKWKRQEYAPRWPERDLVAGCLPDNDAEEGGGAAPPPSGTGEVVETVPEGGGTEGSKVVEEVHQDKTSPVTTPDTSPVEREARARGEGEPVLRQAQDEVGVTEAVIPAETPGRAGFEKRVMRFCTGKGFVAGPWPDWDTSSPGWVARQFAVLTPEERAEAERWRDAYLLDIAARKAKPVAVGNFLNGRLWSGLDPAILDRAERQKQAKLAPEDRSRPDGWAPCLGPVGMAWLFGKLLSGPDDAKAAAEMLARGFWTDAMLRAAWEGPWGWSARLRQAGGGIFATRWHALKGAMEPVPKGSDVLAAWREEFARRGWPWLAAFDGGEVVYCPKGGPAGLDEFEAMVRAAETNGEGEGHAARDAAE